MSNIKEKQKLIRIPVACRFTEFNLFHVKKLINKRFIHLLTFKNESV